VPIIDNVSIYRLAEPFDALYTQFYLDDLEAHEERWVAHTEAVSLIKSTFESPKTVSRSKMVWSEEESCKPLNLPLKLSCSDFAG
jgi:hypothetical protein